MNEIRDFLKALTENPEAMEMMKAAKEPPNMKEAAAQYAEIAEKAGISVTKEAIQELLEEKEKVQQAATAKAESAVKEALNPEDLDQVAGGKDPRCADTFNIGEWCWFTDSCSYVINSYSDQSYAKVTEEIIGGEEWTVIDDCKLTQMGINMSSCGRPAYDIRGTVPGE